MGYRDRGGGDRGGDRGGGDRGGYGGGFEQREAPVRPGEEYDVQITDVAQKGDGIAKVEGFIIFIAGASKGESCRIRIKDVRRRFAIGEKVGSAGAAAATPEEGGAEETPEQG
ncbi:TRAM domain protein [Candidatus Norongarragalina meridionalis]|nr:TRAM domain protein [Candidatus Norongarragalina meridionalis]